MNKWALPTSGQASGPAMRHESMYSLRRELSILIVHHSSTAAKTNANMLWFYAATNLFVEADDLLRPTNAPTLDVCNIRCSGFIAVSDARAGQRVQAIMLSELHDSHDGSGSSDRPVRAICAFQLWPQRCALRLALEHIYNLFVVFMAKVSAHRPGL